MDSTTYIPWIHPNSPLAKSLVETLAIFGQKVGEVNVANGWDTSRDMIANPDKYDPKWITTHRIAELGLIGTEVAEAIEEVRNGRAPNETYYGKPGASAFLDNGFPAKPEGLASELADIIIRVLDISDAEKIDVGAALIEKLNHNATRGLRHGGKTL